VTPRLGCGGLSRADTQQQHLPDGKPSHASFAVTISNSFALNKEQQRITFYQNFGKKSCCCRSKGSSEAYVMAQLKQSEVVYGLCCSSAKNSPPTRIEEHDSCKLYNVEKITNKMLSNCDLKAKGSFESDDCSKLELLQ
jgi:hypothetical protein